MAIRGRKPKPPFLKLVTGNPGHRPIPHDPAVSGGYFKPIEPPVKLQGREAALWVEFIRTAGWLTAHDATTALVWVKLYAEFERNPEAMIAGKIGQLRAAASEIGLGGPGSRARFGVDGSRKEDPAEVYFG